jgi:hypothetical protein
MARGRDARCTTTRAFDERSEPGSRLSHEPDETGEYAERCVGNVGNVPVTRSAGGGIRLWAPAAITVTGQGYARRKAAIAFSGERPHARAERSVCDAARVGKTVSRCCPVSPGQHWSSSWCACVRCTRATCSTARGVSRCQRRSIVRRLPGPRTWRGSGCFPPRAAIGTPPVGKSAGITCTRPRCSAQCSALFARLGSQSGDVSHAAALLRDAPAGRRVRYSDAAGTVGTHGRQYDDDLHPRAEPRGVRRPESSGSAGWRIADIAMFLAAFAQ